MGDARWDRQSYPTDWDTPLYYEITYLIYRSTNDEINDSELISTSNLLHFIPRLFPRTNRPLKKTDN